MTETLQQSTKLTVSVNKLQFITKLLHDSIFRGSFDSGKTVHGLFGQDTE